MRASLALLVAGARLAAAAPFTTGSIVILRTDTVASTAVGGSLVEVALNGTVVRAKGREGREGGTPAAQPTRRVALSAVA